MKKFLVILMVLAMASVLFVGCTTPPTPDPDPDPTPVVVVSATPVLTDIQTSAGVSIVTVTSTSTQYMNIADVGSSILVTGTAPSESLIQIYLDDVAVAPAVAEASTSGLWSVAIAKSSLGDDGVKVMTAKCTEVGLDEGEASNAGTFTLDTVKPSASTLAITAAAAGTGTLTSTITAGIAVVDSFTTTGAAISAGTWTVSTVAASGTALNIKVTDGTNPLYYTVANATQIFTNVIPGVKFALNQATAYASVGNTTTLVITNATTIAARGKILFSEEITNASAIAAATYTFSNGGTVLSYSAKYTYFSGGFTSAQGITNTCSVNGAVDLAGNTQTTASVLSCTVGAASATSLAP